MPYGLMSADETGQVLVETILADMDVPSGHDVALLVNGLGGTAQLDLYILYRAARRALEAAGNQVSRSLVGNYITSLDMAGCSVTVLKADDELLKLWDAPVSTAGLRWGL